MKRQTDEETEMDIQREKKETDKWRGREKHRQKQRYGVIIERQKEKGIKRQRDEIKNRGDRNREKWQEKDNYKERGRDLSIKRQTGRWDQEKGEIETEKNGEEK
jgi:hypothetical protein